jgi:hypothetical protein
MNEIMTSMHYDNPSSPLPQASIYLAKKTRKMKYCALKKLGIYRLETKLGENPPDNFFEF